MSNTGPLSFQFGDVNMKEPECVYSIDSPEYRAQVQSMEEMISGAQAQAQKIVDALEKSTGRKFPNPIVTEELVLRCAIAEAITALDQGAPGVAREALVRVMSPQPKNQGQNPPF